MSTSASTRARRCGRPHRRGGRPVADLPAVGSADPARHTAAAVPGAPARKAAKPLEKRSGPEQERSARACGVAADLVCGVRVLKGIGVEPAAVRRCLDCPRAVGAGACVGRPDRGGPRCETGAGRLPPRTGLPDRAGSAARAHARSTRRGRAHRAGPVSCSAWSRSTRPSPSPCTAWPRGRPGLRHSRARRGCTR